MADDVAQDMPDELGALKKVTEEFVTKISALDNEIEEIKQTKKDIVEEYKRKLDIKTLNAALRVLKIKSEVQHQNTFDMFMEVLQDPAQ